MLFKFQDYRESFCHFDLPVIQNCVAITLCDSVEISTYGAIFGYIMYTQFSDTSVTKQIIVCLCVWFNFAVVDL